MILTEFIGLLPARIAVKALMAPRCKRTGLLAHTLTQASELGLY